MLYQQQITYSEKSNALIGSIQAYAENHDMANQAQITLMGLAASFPMNSTVAVSYFPNITSAYWVGPGLVDYYALYAAQIAYTESQKW